MDTIRYNQCTECEEENFFTDAAKCAHCLGLNYFPVADSESEPEPLDAESEYLAA